MKGWAYRLALVMGLVLCCLAGAAGAEVALLEEMAGLFDGPEWDGYVAVAADPFTMREQRVDFAGVVMQHEETGRNVLCVLTRDREELTYAIDEMSGGALYAGDRLPEIVFTLYDDPEMPGELAIIYAPLQADAGETYQWRRDDSGAGRPFWYLYGMETDEYTPRIVKSARTFYEYLGGVPEGAYNIVYGKAYHRMENFDIERFPRTIEEAWATAEVPVRAAEGTQQDPLGEGLAATVTADATVLSAPGEGALPAGTVAAGDTVRAIALHGPYALCWVEAISDEIPLSHDIFESAQEVEAISGEIPLSQGFSESARGVDAGACVGYVAISALSMETMPEQARMRYFEGTMLRGAELLDGPDGAVLRTVAEGERVRYLATVGADWMYVQAGGEGLQAKSSDGALSSNAQPGDGGWARGFVPSDAVSVRYDMDRWVSVGAMSEALVTRDVVMVEDPYRADPGEIMEVAGGTVLRYEDMIYGEWGFVYLEVDGRMRSGFVPYDALENAVDPEERLMGVG